MGVGQLPEAHPVTRMNSLPRLGASARANALCHHGRNSNASGFMSMS